MLGGQLIILRTHWPIKGPSKGWTGGFVCCLSIVFFYVLSLFLVLSSGGYNALIPSFSPPVGGWLFCVFLFPLQRKFLLLIQKKKKKLR